MQNDYRLSSQKAINHARAINRALDDIVMPGVAAISILIFALALRLEDSATDAASLEELLAMASTHTKAAATIQFNKRDSNRHVKS